MSELANLSLRLKQGDKKAIQFVLSQLLKSSMITVEIKESGHKSIDINLYADYDIPETSTSKSVKSKMESSGIQEVSSFCIYAVNSKSGENLWQHRFELSSPSLEEAKIVANGKAEKSVKFTKKKSLAIFLAVCTGIFGGHHFYLGNNLKGWLYFLFFWTYIPLILTFFDILYLIRISASEFNKLYSQSPHSSQVKNSENSHQSKEQVNHEYSEVCRMMDYFKLVQLLENNQWHQADRLTKLIMLRLAKRDDDSLSGGWLRPEDIEAIPMEDFLLLDFLWLKSSEGYYSFTAQRAIWKKVGSPCSNNEDWERFGVNVGWRTNFESTWSHWKVIGSESWRWDSKEVGHLPCECFMRPGFLGVGTQRAWLGVSHTCKKIEKAGNYIKDPKFLEFSKLVDMYWDGMRLSKHSHDGSVAEGIQIRLDKIEEILKENNWNKADQETKALLYEIVSCQERQSLEIEHITEFSKYVWIKLDNLWTQYSHGKYGFSIQKKVWKSMGSSRYYVDGWEEFGQKIGWFIGGDWIKNSEVQYTDQAPKGHLPSLDERWRGSRYVTRGPQYGYIIYLFLCDYF